MNKFEGLPPIHYVSIEESLDRRKNLEKQFKNFNITNFVPHIFKRYEEGDYVINGPLVHLLADYSKAAQSSHFLLLRDWYDNCDDPYILVFEDDLSLDTSLYWNFTWKEFQDNLPEDWDCIQLCIIDAKPREKYFFQVRDCNNDWSAAAYLIKREYTKYLLDRYYCDGTFNLDIKEYNCVPVLEQSLFLNERGHVYSFPLFVEDNYKFSTTNRELFKDEYNMHHISYDSIMNWWKNIGSELSIKTIMQKNMNHIYEQPQFGENWFSYPNLYKNVVERFPSGSTFVEIGCWKGRSASFMSVEIANSQKDIEFYCIDTWEGSVEHQDNEDLDSLYDIFTNNMKSLKDYYTPIRMTSLEASKKFEDNSIDFVFIDASHEYEDVKNDIIAWLPKVKKGGIIAGHDYYLSYDYFPGVKQAVHEIFNIDDLILSEECWIYNIKDNEKTMNILDEFSSDTENGEKNYNLARWYEEQGHTAPAHSYYLRASERTENKNLAYNSLIRASFCYKSQGSRDGTEKILLENALMLLPKRPEAYYFLSMLYEKKGEWQNCYIYSSLGIDCYENELDNIDIPEYPGKCSLILQKAVSSWWWGKGEESRKLFIDLYKNYWNKFDQKSKDIIMDNIKKLNIDIEESMNWGIPNQEFINQVSNEIFEEKIYERFYQVKEGDIVVDIGASSGPFTYSILNKNPKKVYCLEPSKNFFKSLEENTKNHSVKCINKAIVSENYNKDQDLYVFWEEDFDNIDTITFKKFIEENNISSIDLLKMDCEAGEYDIFTEENLDFLLNNVNNIVAEFHHVYKEDGCHYKFQNFKNNILPKIPNYKIYSIGNNENFDITDELYFSNYIESNYHQVMIYISKEPFPNQKKKIVDCFRFYNEKELLELRYHLLKDKVDKFVIAQGTKTFSGNPTELLAKKYIKELNLPEDKFIIIDVDLPDNNQNIENTEVDVIYRSFSGPSTDTYKNSLNARTRERMILDSLMNAISQFNDDDVFFVSDCDEIINPECIEYFAYMARKHTNQLIKVPLVELQGRANLRAYNKETNIPVSTDNVFFVCTGSHFKSASPTQLRYDINNPFEVVYIIEGGKRLEECGWHFSWMGDSNRLKLKQKSTSHYADIIDSALIKDMSSPELQKFIDEWKPNADGINPWGHTDFVLKEYPEKNLPQKLFEFENLKSFFLDYPKNNVIEKKLKDSNGYDVYFNSQKTEKNLYSDAIEKSLEIALKGETTLPNSILDMQGMSGRKYRIFINNLISLLDNPKYLEIGSWKGSTFFSAIHSNDVEATGIDNWSEFGGPREEFYSNFERYTNNQTKEKINFIEDDFRNLKNSLNKKYNVYLFDGPHKQNDHYDSLLLFYESLEDEFIFICDDWNWEEIKNGTMSAIKELNLNILYSLEIKTFGKDSGNEGGFSDWHNGYYIAVCKKTKKYSIPVIGVPIVNGVNWLKRLIDSVDYPVDEFFIINNSGKEEIGQEIEDICKTSHNFIGQFKICNLPSNLGVSGAWNLIIKSYIMSPYWIICNNDVAFTPGFLNEMVNKSKNSDVGIVHCSSGDNNLGSYECFLLKDWVVQKCGLFDENFYPCYVEDIDYTIRTNSQSIKKDFVNLSLYHGETQDYSQSGSQTWRSDASLKEKIDNSRILNESEYMIKKWGNDWYSIFINNTNNCDYEKAESYDLNFNRKKYLGF